MADAQSEAVLNSRPEGKRTTIFTIKDASLSLYKAHTAGLTEIPKPEKNDLRDTIAREKIGVLREVLIQTGICTNKNEASKVPAKTTRNEDAASSIKTIGATDALYDHICNKHDELKKQQEYLQILLQQNNSSISSSSGGDSGSSSSC